MTTQVIGNCGMSPAPLDKSHLPEMRSYWGKVFSMPEVDWRWRTFGEYLKVLETGGLSINVASLAGHAALRMSTMGLEERSPLKAELEHMQTLLAEAMQSGAFGLSTGLVYPPGCFACTGEIISLAGVVGKYKGLSTPPTSAASGKPFWMPTAKPSPSESAAGIPVQISHNCPKFGAPHDATANLTLVEDCTGTRSGCHRGQ